MTLEEAILKLTIAYEQAVLVHNSKVYQASIQIGHPDLATDLGDVQHYLTSAIERLKELQNE